MSKVVEKELEVTPELYQKIVDMQAKGTEESDFDSYAYQPIDLDGLAEAKYDVEAFQSGVNIMSEIAGMICALSNVGIEPSEALNYICAIKTLNHQSAVNEKNNASNIEIARLSGEAQMKQQM